MTDKKYNPPIKETKFSRISVHNKPEIAPGNAWVVTDKNGRNTVDFLKSAGTAELRDVFAAVSGLPDDGNGKFILFHAINPNDSVQHTNSKLPNLHIHVYTADFAAEFTHISDPAIKSYTVQPNSNLAAAIRHKTNGASTDSEIISLDKSTGGEIATHEILIDSRFASFDDFIWSAADDILNEYRNKLVTLLEPKIAEGQGGARIIIDDRYTNTGTFITQILSGENMDRSGQNKQRYFEKPFKELNI